MTSPFDKSLFVRSTGYAFLVPGISFLIPLLTTPYIIHRVSYGMYGAWVALNTLSLWLAHYDLGLSGALTREVADRRARGNLDGIRTLGATWFYYDVLIGGAIVGGIVALGRTILDEIVPGADASEMYPVLVLFSVQSALTAFLRHLSSTLCGYQRVDLANRLAIWIIPLSVGGIVFFLEFGWGILGLILNSLISLGVQIVGIKVMLRRLGCPLSVSPALFRSGDLKTLFNFGWKLEAGQLLMMVFGSDRLLLSATGQPLYFVTLYQLGASVAQKLNQIVAALSSTVLPAVSDLAARGDVGRIRLILMRGTKYHALAATGLLGFAALFAKELMVLWMGRPLPDAALVLRIMSAGCFASAVVCCAHAVGVALGRPGWQLASIAAGFAGAVALYFAAGRRYDCAGLAGSVSGGIVLINVVFLAGFKRFMPFQWREYVGNALLRPLCVAVPLAVIYAAWRVILPHFPVVETRPFALAVLAPAFGVSMGLAWLGARALRVVDDYDMDMLKSLFRRARA